MTKEYVKFCFVQSNESHYTQVIRKASLIDSYQIAKKNMIIRMKAMFGKWNFTDVSFQLQGDKTWSRISWKI